MLTSKGTILPCEKVPSNLYIDDINGDEKCNQLNFEAISKLYRKYATYLKKTCKNCFAQSTCQKCLFDLDIKDDRIVCPHFLSKNKLVQSMSQLFSFISLNPNKVQEYYESK